MPSADGVLRAGPMPRPRSRTEGPEGAAARRFLEASRRARGCVAGVSHGIVVEDRRVGVCRKVGPPGLA